MDTADSSSKVDRTVVLVEHENGVIHVRATPGAFPPAAAALQHVGATWDADLRWVEHPRSSEEDFTVVDLAIHRLDTPLEDLKAALEERVSRVFIYVGSYDTRGPGPTWRFRPALPPSPGREGTVLCHIDYGWEAGTWFFGHPRNLDQANRWAVEANLETYGVTRDGANRVTCFAVDAGCQGPIVERAGKHGFDVWTDEFRPC